MSDPVQVRKGTRASDAQFQRLGFDVEVAIRYHDRRRGFFDTAHRTVLALNVFVATAIVSQLSVQLGLQPYVQNAGLALVALVNILDLVVGFSERARVHDAFFKSYYALDKEMASTNKDVADSADLYRKWLSQFMDIGKDEGVIYKALYALCQNEAAGVWKLETGFSRVGFVRSLLAHFLPMSNANFPPQPGRKRIQSATQSS